ncbi:MAG: hypothetical protein CL846_02870 [Crocinitomicaceae bacterium]|nr:hypothetical protein [Crocinitomicaceae bacterium]
MNDYLKSYFSIIFIIFFSLFLNAQKSSEVLHVSKLIEDITSCEDSIFQLTDTNVKFDFRIYKDDIAFYSGGNIDYYDSVVKSRDYNVHCEVFLKNVSFREDLIMTFRHIEFNKPVVIFEMDNWWGGFSNCDFKKGLIIVNSNIKDIWFNNCSFNGIYFYNNNIGELSFKRSSFKRDITNTSILLGDIFRDFDLGLVENDNELINTLIINECDFKERTLYTDSSDYQNIFVVGGEFKNVEIDNSNFNKAIFSSNKLNVKSRFEVKESNFGYPLGFNGVNFLKNNTHFDYSLISGGKICLRDHNSDDFFVPYLANSNEQLSDVFNYKELISVYNKFFNMYKTRGDMTSANQCYVDLKEIETKMLAYEYSQNKTLNKFFELYINKFLKLFCDYGTNPAKSLIISFYIIILFAVFYFFFFSSWDQINRGFLIKQYRKILVYLTTDKHLVDFFDENQNEKIQSFNEFKQELSDARNKLPLFFYLLSRPLYQVSILKYKLLKFFYKKSEFNYGEWKNYSFRNRVFKSLLLFSFITFYGLYLFLLRALNSFVLSVNTFSTLGFGDIPVKGLSRYVAVIQGFIGWFLLTIFSVSLISQILQL